MNTENEYAIPNVAIGIPQRRRELVDREARERQVLATPLDRRALVVGAVKLDRRRQVAESAQHPAAAAAEVQHGAGLGH